MTDVLISAGNLAILIAILVIYLRKPLREFVQQRHVGLRDELQRVAEQLRLAQVKFDDFSAKLKAVEVEAAALRDQAEHDASAMKLRITTEAKQQADGIVLDARSASGAMVEEFKKQLRLDLALRVIERTEAIVRERLTGDDRLRIRREFSLQVERIQ